MQHIWAAFSRILTLIALSSAVQRELENTGRHDGIWLIKQQPGVFGVSVNLNF